jgi:methylenetetrahydrofolate reductase (NADPH)
MAQHSTAPLFGEAKPPLELQNPAITNPGAAWSLRNRLGNGFLFTAELDPPRGSDPHSLLAEANALLGLVDAVNISDSPQANLRMTPLVAAHLVQTRVGLPVIAHFTCRDRNIIGLQSELLGAAALGVANILCLRGDAPERGDHPQATGVFEVDAVGLSRMVRQLNANRSLAGREIEGTSFTVAVAANPGAQDLQLERERFAEKVAAGAHFAQTQPVFDLKTIENFLNIVEPKIPVLFGVLPVRSVEMAARVSKWTSLPQGLIDDLGQQGRKAGLQWAKQVVHELRSLHEHHHQVVSGAHLYPLGRPSVVSQVLAPAAEPESGTTTHGETA